MWPSGEAGVSKTLNDGSIPSMTTVHRQAIVKAGGISIPPNFIKRLKLF